MHYQASREDGDDGRGADEDMPSTERVAYTRCLQMQSLNKLSRHVQRQMKADESLTVPATSGWPPTSLCSPPSRTLPPQRWRALPKPAPAEPAAATAHVSYYTPNSRMDTRFHNLSVCSPAVCGLRSAICHLPSAICNATPSNLSWVRATCTKPLTKAVPLLGRLLCYHQTRCI